MKLGMKSHEIAKYQGILGLVADGIFGKITEQHVRSFQREHGLQQDGRIGPLTAAALEKVGKVNYVATEKTPAGQFQLSDRSRQRYQRHCCGRQPFGLGCWRFLHHDAVQKDCV